MTAERRRVYPLNPSVNPHKPARDGVSHDVFRVTGSAAGCCCSHLSATTELMKQDLKNTKISGAMLGACTVW